MERFLLLGPGDADAIRAAAGRRATVLLVDGSTREAIIRDVESGVLLLDEDTRVRGGAMFYVDRIPLAEVHEIRIWED